MVRGCKNLFSKEPEGPLQQGQKTQSHPSHQGSWGPPRTSAETARRDKLGWPGVEQSWGCRTTVSASVDLGQLGD